MDLKRLTFAVAPVVVPAPVPVVVPAPREEPATLAPLSS